MSIQEIVTNIKRFFMDTDAFLAVLTVLVATIGFGLGRLSVPQNSPENKVIPMVEQTSSALVLQGAGVLVQTGTTTTTTVEKRVDPVPQPGVGQYVASKTGKKYHLPWCPGAKQIKEENKVWFSTKAEAEKAGYTPASNCKGL